MCFGENLYRLRCNKTTRNQQPQMQTVQPGQHLSAHIQFVYHDVEYALT